MTKGNDFHSDDEPKLFSALLRPHRALSRTWHPDKHGGDREAALDMQTQLNRARELLLLRGEDEL